MPWQLTYAGFGHPNSIPSLTLCVFASIHEGPNFRRGTTRGSSGGTAAARWGKDVGSSDHGDAHVARRRGDVHGCGGFGLQRTSDVAVFLPEGRGGVAEIGEEIEDSWGFLEIKQRVCHPEKMRRDCLAMGMTLIGRARERPGHGCSSAPNPVSPSARQCFPGHSRAAAGEAPCLSQILRSIDTPQIMSPDWS